MLASSSSLWLSGDPWLTPGYFLESFPASLKMTCPSASSLSASSLRWFFARYLPSGSLSSSFTTHRYGVRPFPGIGTVSVISKTYRSFSCFPERSISATPLDPRRTLRYIGSFQVLRSAQAVAFGLCAWISICSSKLYLYMRQAVSKKSIQADGPDVIFSTSWAARSFTFSSFPFLCFIYCLLHPCRDPTSFLYPACTAYRLFASGFLTSTSVL